MVSGCNNTCISITKQYFQLHLARTFIQIPYIQKHYCEDNNYIQFTEKTKPLTAFYSMYYIEEQLFWDIYPHILWSTYFTDNVTCHLCPKALYNPQEVNVNMLLS